MTVITFILNKANICLLNFARTNYSKICLKRPLSQRPKIDFQDLLLLIAGHLPLTRDQGAAGLSPTGGTELCP